MGQPFGFREDRGEEEEVSRVTRGLVEGVSALLTGQVRERWSTDHLLDLGDGPIPKGLA